MSDLPCNCLNCARPYHVKFLDKPQGYFIAWTPAGELFGKNDSICRNDCRLGGWLPCKALQQTH